MKIIKTIKDMREYSRRAHREGKTIGLVPTMGHLHRGHVSLVRAAKKECDTVIVSVFVNPTQFGPKEDFKKYPRDIERDKKICAKAGTDVIFIPGDSEMYPQGYATFVEMKGLLTETMCGASRPGHFRGVATVVIKLFNIVRPDLSYFGQKDAQQVSVIKKMVKDLNIDTRVRVMPIVRERDGLAMSSRNVYLSPDERAKALYLYRALKKAGEMVKKGARSSSLVKKETANMLRRISGVKVDYIAITDPDTLEPVNKIRERVLIAVAVFVGKTRLIDNIVIHSVKREAPSVKCFKRSS